MPTARHQIQAKLRLRKRVASLAWLEGTLEWYEGRVVWRDRRGLMAPDPTDIAVAQHHLHQVGRAVATARHALGIDAAWLARRTERLNEAIWLAPLAAPDLKALAQPIHYRQPVNLRRLTALLAAEALCANDLPASPAVALAAAGAPAIPFLAALLADQRAPAAAQHLAALVLGAIYAKTDAAGSAIELSPGLQAPGPNLNAFTWGKHAGLPPDPPLLAAILAAADGPALAARFVHALSITSRFSLSPALLHELVLNGAATPAAIVALAEAGAGAAPLAEQITRRRELPGETSRPRRALAERLFMQRLEAVAAVAELVQRYARATSDAVLVTLLVEFVQAMLTLADMSPDLQRAISATLEQGLTLPPVLIRPYLQILVADHQRLWPLHEARSAVGPLAFAAWLKARQPHVAALVTLLQTTQKPTLAQQLLSSGLHLRVARARWRTSTRYELLLIIAEQLPIAGNPALVEAAISALRSLRLPHSAGCWNCRRHQRLVACLLKRLSGSRQTTVCIPEFFEPTTR